MKRLEVLKILQNKMIKNNIILLQFFPAGLSMEINDYLGNDTLSEGVS